MKPAPMRKILRARPRNESDAAVVKISRMRADWLRCAKADDGTVKVHGLMFDSKIFADAIDWLGGDGVCAGLGVPRGKTGVFLHMHTPVGEKHVLLAPLYSPAYAIVRVAMQFAACVDDPWTKVEDATTALSDILPYHLPTEKRT